MTQLKEKRGIKNMENKLRNSFRILHHGFKKRLIVRDFEFDSSERFHANNIDVLLYKYHAQMSSGIGGWQFLPRLKTCVQLLCDL